MFPAKNRLRAALLICLCTGLCAAAGQEHLALRQNPFDPDHKAVEEVAGGDEAVPTLTGLMHDAGLSADLAAAMVLEKAARRAGLDIHSVANRKNRPLPGAEHLEVVRVYLGYDAELPALLRFFDLLEEADLTYAVENLNIATRRQPRHDVTRSPRTKALNGNMIVAVHTGDALPASVPEDSPFRQARVVNRLVNGLADVMPGDTYLTSLVKKGDEVVFFGQTTDVQDVMARLTRWDLVEDIQSTAAVVTPREGGPAGFRLRGTLVPN